MPRAVLNTPRLLELRGAKGLSSLGVCGIARVFAVGFALFAFDCAAAPSASAQQNLLDGGNLQIDSNQPMLLDADELVYDNQNNRVTAKGNVQIYFNNYTLVADKVIYDQSANTLEAEGNVRIKEPDGAIVNADRITLTDDFRDGFIGSLRIVTKDDARIAAASATRQDGGETTIFDRAVFTPCKACEKNPDKAPLWRIKAAKIIHKRAEGNIYYENATLEIFGVPVAWFPYFYHPDPTVKRRSGFLIPKVGQSQDLGYFAEIPYHYVLSANMDLTVNPKFMSKQGILLQGTWRHRTENGAYNVKMAGIHQNDRDEVSDFQTGPLDNEWRGSIETKGRFALGSWWHYGWDVTLESDDTFRRFYKLDSVVRTDRVSLGYIEGLNDRNYFGAYLYHFGGLLADDSSNAESAVHPSIDYNYIFADPVLGGELSFNGNVLSLSRDNGADSSRVVADVQWRKQMIDSFGQVITPFAQARGDIYKVSNHLDGATNFNTDDEFVTRGTVAAGLQYSFPFVANTSNASHVIEPVGQIIARPDDNDQVAVPNEDAQSLVFDDTLLFDTDKFSGYDRIETGVRANVGMRYTVQRNNGGYFRAIVGQSYQLSGDNPFDLNSGLATSESDYVAGLYFQPSSTMSLLAQGRFDDDTFELQRGDVIASLSYGPLSTSARYTFVADDALVNESDDQQEIQISSNLRVTDYWSVFGAARYDIGDEEFRTSQLGVKYSDECFVLAVTYQETNVEDRDIDTDRTILVQVEFKHLGGTSFQSSVVDQLVADSE